MGSGNIIESEIEKPLISILMAIYEPNLGWLREQLESLNQQTYPNLCLYVIDDCSETMEFEEIQDLLNRYITAFPWSLERNMKNIGSNGTFEILTSKAKGEYFAYCDQDDIWNPEKLEKLQVLLQNSTMAYSDMTIIDENSVVRADSLKEIRPRLQYLEGRNLSEYYFFRNCTAGCTMLVKSEVARDALPFPKNTVWDQWIAIIASMKGSISFSNEKLIAYRQHGHNQTGILTGVQSYDDYYRVRLEPLKERLTEYKRHQMPSEQMLRFINARLNRKWTDIWRYRYLSPYDAIAEIGACLMPHRVYDVIIRRKSIRQPLK